MRSIILLALIATFALAQSPASDCVNSLKLVVETAKVFDQEMKAHKIFKAIQTFSAAHTDVKEAEAICKAVSDQEWREYVISQLPADVQQCYFDTKAFAEKFQEAKAQWTKLDTLQKMGAIGQVSMVADKVGKDCKNVKSA